MARKGHLAALEELEKLARDTRTLWGCESGGDPVRLLPSILSRDSLSEEWVGPTPCPCLYLVFTPVPPYGKQHGFDNKWLYL